MEQNMIEWYRSRRQMPDWIYYQINGKSAQENYAQILRERDKNLLPLLENQIENELQPILENVMSKLLYGLS